MEYVSPPPPSHFEPATPPLEDTVIAAMELENISLEYDRLPYLNRLVVDMRHGLNGHRPHSLDEIGRACNMTRHIAKRHLLAAYDRLRSHITEAEAYDAPPQTGQQR